MKFYVLMKMYLVILCFMKNVFWMIQYMIYFLVVMFMLMPIKGYLIFSLSYIFSCDIISYFLILLSIWICMLMLMASFGNLRNNFFMGGFMLSILFMLLMLVCTSKLMNLLIFYLFSEGSLIPILFLIMGWGYQPERIQAGLYLLFYTLFVSLPMLLGIFYMDFKYFSLMIYLMKFVSLNYSVMYLVLMLSFLVKIPMFFVHLWLPKAHVEAPVSGSMILAGIMLKLGGYGIMRVLIFMENLNMKFNSILISISLLGALYVSLMCFFQIDLKSLIAYSSVVHMGLMLGGLLTLTNWGFVESKMEMIGHGFNNFYSGECRELNYDLLLFLHWVPLNVLILKMDFFFLNWIYIFIDKYSSSSFFKFTGGDYINCKISNMIFYFNVIDCFSFFFFCSVWPLFILFCSTGSSIYKFKQLLFYWISWIFTFTSSLTSFKCIIFKVRLYNL
uniref:NADH-ubiquinone oxidoreductase chain 4 n=1 Tax=Phryganopsyche latipennis TaxID=177652 RepID=A0A4Y1JWK4_9NEOP|nr:NADH dehydrogenase subunit 4 [Phryganopsyche latipennis]APQ47898.1 NADH dehydrogenase subunit 4 [Phryganopsyche latipennis]